MNIQNRIHSQSQMQKVIKRAGMNQVPANNNHPQNHPGHRGVDQATIRPSEVTPLPQSIPNISALFN